MTEKRFSVECDDADIWEDNHFLAVAYDHHNALKFAERLNELAEENEQLRELLKIGKTNAKDIIDVLNIQEQYKIKANELEKENEQLKSEIKDLNDILARYEEKELVE